MRPLCAHCIVLYGSPTHFVLSVCLFAFARTLFFGEYGLGYAAISLLAAVWEP